MPAIIIIGAQWGDEGKGKIVDFLAEKANMVIRYSGGNNAGHTVVNQYGQFGLHLMPSGIFNPSVVCVIGNGVVVDPAVLLKEIDLLQARGVDTSHLIVSSRAHLIMPYHILLDGLEEEAKGGGALGTTKMGVGPAYVDKMARLGIRVGDLLEREAFHRRLSEVIFHKNTLLTRVYGKAPVSVDEIFDTYCKYADRLAPYIKETDILVEKALEDGKLVLLEGAQGTLLDIDFGTYPYVTSSSPSAGGACTGLGISPRKIGHILGIFKCYPTRVGGGPMPTEIKDEIGQLIRERGHEYGTTTGRARRCGWFDGVGARYSSRINSFTDVAITRLDIFDTLETIKICTSYMVDGTRMDNFPASIDVLQKCQPVYEEMPGWRVPTSDIRHFEKLPPAAQNYIRRIEQLIKAPISLVSVGPRREQTIWLKAIV
ncbi:MAG: adenylosuccinate synthase [Dehalococcoidia bacterium]|nr:adenylosuccinate synthase [Dehalococcoidia bacterium]